MWFLVLTNYSETQGGSFANFLEVPTALWLDLLYDSGNMERAHVFKAQFFGLLGGLQVFGREIHYCPLWSLLVWHVFHLLAVYRLCVPIKPYHPGLHGLLATYFIINVSNPSPTLLTSISVNYFRSVGTGLRDSLGFFLHQYYPYCHITSSAWITKWAFGSGCFNVGSTANSCLNFSNATWSTVHLSDWLGFNPPLVFSKLVMGRVTWVKEEMNW